MLKITQPATQIRLTNVAVVRLRFGGQRFEIACYPNKVRDWRAGTEKDVREVLQSHRIFVNVNKGEFAKDSDLEKHFSTADVNHVSRIILDRGDVQLSAKERRVVREEFVREVCGLAAERLVSTKTSLPLTPATVEQTARQLRCLPKYKEGVTSKAACARLIARLTSKLPDEIARAMLRADIVHGSVQEDVARQLDKLFGAQILSQETGDGSNRIAFRVSTADYQKLCDFVSQQLGQNAELVVISMLDRTATSQKAPKSISQPVEVKQHPVSESSSSEAVRSSSEEEEMTDEDVPDSTRPTNFSALISSESDADQDSRSESNRPAHGDQSALSVEQLKALLESEKPEKLDTKIKRVPLDADVWSRKQQRKKQERKEKDRDRKLLEEQAAAKAKAKAEDMQRQLEAQEIEEASKEKPILEGGPGWCVDCQINFVTSLGQDLRQHYRMDWHTFNAKRRLRDKPPISRKEFDELSRDIKEGFLAVTF
eukprot:Gregarina_sp_Poly_1__4217@NODE_22_length_20656_cov_110_706397_g20_i0_p6_GENE_NODE_22_length_20656_cov_110_706397_g20_i0NODE_22_length_20656_cov_110_706397_g20_i0_p6_ORF_typecomplete_len484_score89_46SBDS/PF01172_18/1_1e29SBDS_C/PF09377_10/0_00032SBDS_C/PF09377_10/3_1e03tRNAsynt_1e/PF01406_19/0_34Hamartin/PF04388_12/0_35Borrelia_P83/PF05262_11/6_NODE_22_length_20656_cov_110_706397_g20_i037895240